MQDDAIYSRVMALWLFSTKASLKPISKEEEILANDLPERQARQFRHSRGYLRDALAGLWQVSALDIPLRALPGKPPELQQGWGHVSLSHCRDALLVGWAFDPLGVDLERADRNFEAAQVANRYFSEEEKEAISGLGRDAQRGAVLDQWLIKEASIKWQRGSLASDLTHWHSDFSFAIHDLHGYRLKVHRIHYKSWRMAAVFDEAQNYLSPLLCLDL